MADRAGVSILTGCILTLWFVSMLLVSEITQRKVSRDFQDAAFERGYAEWILPEHGRGKIVWRWVEPEKE